MPSRWTRPSPPAPCQRGDQPPRGAYTKVQSTLSSTPETASAAPSMITARSSEQPSTPQSATQTHSKLRTNREIGGTILRNIAKQPAAKQRTKILAHAPNKYYSRRKFAEPNSIP